MPHLLNRATGRVLIRTPMQQLCAVSKTVPREMIVLHFHDKFRRERLPLSTSLGAPPARAARFAAGESGRLNDLFQLFRQRWFFGGRKARGKAYVVQEPVLVVQSEQERPHDRFPRPVTKSAHNTIRRTKILDLQHGLPSFGIVW